jgi:hypothetical protein
LSVGKRAGLESEFTQVKASFCNKPTSRAIKDTALDSSAFDQSSSPVTGPCGSFLFTTLWLLCSTWCDRRDTCLAAGWPFVRVARLFAVAMPLGPWPLAWRPPGRLLEAEGGLPRGPPTLAVEDRACVVVSSLFVLLRSWLGLAGYKK